MGYEYTNGMGATGTKTGTSTATATLTQLQQAAAQAAKQIAQARVTARQRLSQTQASVLATAQNQLALLQEQIRASKVTAATAVTTLVPILDRAQAVLGPAAGVHLPVMPVQLIAAQVCKLRGGLWSLASRTCVMPSIPGKQQFIPLDAKSLCIARGGVWDGRACTSLVQTTATPQQACVQQGYPWYWNDAIGQCVDFSAQVDATVDNEVDNTFIDETIDEEEEGTPPPVVALPAEPVDWKLWGAIGLAAGMVGYALYKGRTPRGAR